MHGVENALLLSIRGLTIGGREGRTDYGKWGKCQEAKTENDCSVNKLHATPRGNTTCIVLELVGDNEYMFIIAPVS